MMTVKQMFRDAFERAVNTFAQGVLTVLSGDTLNVWTADWRNALGVGAGAAVMSLLMTARTWSTRQARGK